jgi:hypothetical protein
MCFFDWFSLIKNAVGIPVVLKSVTHFLTPHKCAFRKMTLEIEFYVIGFISRTIYLNRKYPKDAFMVAGFVMVSYCVF